MLSLKANTSPQPLQMKQLMGNCVHRISRLGNLLISKSRGKPQIPPFFPLFCFCENSFAHRSPTAAKVLPAWFVAQGDEEYTARTRVREWLSRRLELSMANHEACTHIFQIAFFPLLFTCSSYLGFQLSVLRFQCIQVSHLRHSAA